MFELTGRVALVTGAGQGIGAGVARVLADRGAAVAVNDLRPERAEAVARAIEAAGGRAIAVPFDVTDLDAVTAGVEAVDNGLGPVDVLVNNAGNWGAGPATMAKFRDSDPESWRGVIDVNLYGVLHCTRAVISSMAERRWGRVVTMVSAAGVIGSGIGVSTYAAAKGGAIAFMRHLAIENARAGVTANCIALGLMDNVDPGVVLGGQPSATEGAPPPPVKGVPVGRLGTPADAAALCLYLVSEESAWMTGQTLNLNGGIHTT